jgi:hypothetical protein
VKCYISLLLFLCDGLGGLFIAQQLEQDPLTIDFNSAEPLDSANSQCDCLVSEDVND